LNRSQLQAMLWMRRRILVNRLRRASRLSNVMLALLLVVCVVIAVGLFLLAFLVGMAELGAAEPKHVLWAWLGLALTFLFFWMTGLMMELQRSDSMSFRNLLHLPIPLGWVFLYNYLSSFVSLSILLFLPPMLGLALASVVVHGPLMLLGFLLILAFLGMVTALTYQLRGWLARLMEDKRRGRNIVMGITFVFVLLMQLPNLINLSVNLGTSDHRRTRSELMWAAQVEGPSQEAAQEELEAFLEEEARSAEAVQDHVALGAMIVPFGWLPYGMSATFDGRWLPGILCAFGMFGIAGFSLRRSCRATMIGILGGGDSGQGAEEPVEKTPARPRGRHRIPLVERRLPFVGEQASAIAGATLQSLLRAPEAKMVLLSPLILILMFSFMLARNPNLERLAAYAPGMSLAAAAMGMLSIQQFLQNLFGLDRAGFRSYLLSPVRRDRILLGKNLALAPLALTIGLVALVVLRIFVPLDLQHLLGACLQLVSAFLLLSLLGNVISLVAPMRLKEVGMKASGAKLRIILLQLASILMIPLMLSPLLLPWALEYSCRGFAWAGWMPLFVLGHAFLLFAILQVYRMCLAGQGEMLQAREQGILDVLTRDS
jgi:hypothetical protein